MLTLTWWSITTVCCPGHERFSCADIDVVVHNDCSCPGHERFSCADIDVVVHNDCSCPGHERFSCADIDILLFVSTGAATDQGGKCCIQVDAASNETHQHTWMGKTASICVSLVLGCHIVIVIIIKSCH